MASNIKWDPQMDQQLLIAILATCPRVDYAAVAEKLGNGASYNTIRGRIRTLKARHGAATTPSPIKDKSKPPSQGNKATLTRKRKHAPSIVPAQGSGSFIKQEENNDPSPEEQTQASPSTHDQE